MGSDLEGSGEVLFTGSWAKETNVGKGGIRERVSVEMVTRCHYCLPLMVWGVSLHISHLKGRAQRDETIFPEHVVNKLSLVSSHCSTHANSPCCPPCLILIFVSSSIFFITVLEFGTVPYCVLKLWDRFVVPEAAFLQRILLLFAYVNCAAENS